MGGTRTGGQHGTRGRWRRAPLLLAATALLAGGLTASPAHAASRLAPDAAVSSTGQVVTASAESLPAGQRHGFSGSTGAASAQRDPESIIGTDSRVRVDPTTSFPARATVLIKRNGSLHCTGWMVSKDTLVTAGHCVYTGGSGGTWYSGLTFLAGSNGGNAPYGTCTSRKTYAFNGWINDGDWRYDGAIVKLNCTVGSTVGWYGMWWQSASLTGLSTVVRGYPGDKPSTQWLSRDQVRVTETMKIYYDNDTVGGMSGSPVYQTRASGSNYCSGVCAMAIHAYGLSGSSGPGSTHNSGTRITEGKYNTIRSIIAQA